MRSDGWQHTMTVRYIQEETIKSVFLIPEQGILYHCRNMGRKSTDNISGSYKNCLGMKGAKNNEISL